MRYWLFVLIAVLSLAIAGCGGKDSGSQTVAGGSTPSPGSSDNTAAGTGAATQPGLMVTTLSAAEQKLAEDKIKTGQRVAVSTPMKIMAVGDVYTFAVGVKNIYPKTYTFRLKPKLLDAKSPGLSNLIHTDETIEEWLARNNFETFQIDMAQSKVVPLIIEVGKDISSTSKTVPGSYTFEVVVEYESSPRFWDKYNTGEDPLVIKIK